MYTKNGVFSFQTRMMEGRSERFLLGWVIRDLREGRVSYISGSLRFRVPSETGRTRVTTPCVERMTVIERELKIVW